MQLDQLQNDEKMVLLGLFYWVMHADGVVSPEEEEILDILRARIGDRWWEGLLAATQARFPDVRSLAAGCRTVERPAARQLIYDELLRLAGADDFDPTEVELLNWLAVTWGFVTPEDAARADGARAASDAPAQEEPASDGRAHGGSADDEFDLLG